MSSLKKYEYAITVEKCGGISAAAEVLNISQPTLSKFLKKTEDELGIELFDRSTIPLKTTPAGDIFIKTGIKMLDAEKQFQKQLDEIKKNKSAVVRIGISPSRAPYIMPLIIKSYRDAGNSGNIIIEEKTTAELNAHLECGELDMIISLSDATTAEFEGINLFNENLLVAVSKNAYADSVEELFKSQPIISVGRGQVLWQTVNKLIDKTGSKMPEIEAQSIESALALVKMGLGITVVPSYIKNLGTEAQNENIRFLNIPHSQDLEDNSLLNRRVCLFYRRGQYLTDSEQKLIECIKNLKY